MKITEKVGKELLNTVLLIASFIVGIVLAGLVVWGIDYLGDLLYAT